MTFDTARKEHVLTEFLVRVSASVLGELDNADTEKFILGLSDELVQRDAVANVKRAQDGAKLLIVLEVSAGNSQKALDTALEHLVSAARTVPDVGLGWSDGAEWPNGIRTDHVVATPLVGDARQVELAAGF